MILALRTHTVSTDEGGFASVAFLLPVPSKENFRASYYQHHYCCFYHDCSCWEIDTKDEV